MKIIHFSRKDMHPSATLAQNRVPFPYIAAIITANIRPLLRNRSRKERGFHVGFRMDAR